MAATPEENLRKRSATTTALDILSPGGAPGAQDDKQAKRDQTWDALTPHQTTDKAFIQTTFVNHCIYTLARTRFNLDGKAAYQATALSVRDRLLEAWNPTQQHFSNTRCKRVYYLSLEFLVGRALQNAVLNLGIRTPYADALLELGYKLEDLYDEEKDAALGNGGLGRLAACFMDSLATLNLPAWGYGIRYKYGMFAQRIKNGGQVEYPDYWLTYGSQWEIPRLDVTYAVRFYGQSVHNYDAATNSHTFVWEGGDLVQAVAYDYPVPGYGTRNCANIRLWASTPAKEFDLQSFNKAQYGDAIEEKRRSEDISAVLYPNDNTESGKELRLKQQYFFVCATLQDILRRFKKMNLPLTDLPEKVAIQLNDTHPSIGVVELMRVLVDLEGMKFEDAWAIVTKVYSFTNHTVLPEALEKWSVPLMTHLLPRHMEIIYDINYRFLQAVDQRCPGRLDLLSRMSLIEEGNPKMIRMANLAIVGSHTVNGVAALHSELLKTTIFKDFVEYFGEARFQNKTNGVTPRRWLNQANPELSALITQWLESDAWLKDLSLLSGLRAHHKNPELIRAWARVKQEKKAQLAALILRECKVQVNPNALFDVQVKRIHEYKRQLLNILGTVHRYAKILAMTPEQRAAVVPRVVIFGGKAAPGYHMAKSIIRLINAVAAVVNADPVVGDLLKVVFIPNYNVSVAETIIPASELSQHISTAGMEASGTSNMKFALNGGLIVGTMDGANIEIAQEIGEKNMFIFGALSAEVSGLRHNIRFRPQELDPRLKEVFSMIASGVFGRDDAFGQILNSLQNGNDYYLLTVDFASYIDAVHDRVDADYKNQNLWTQKSILSTAGMGFFSSDRTIREYARDIWHIEACPCPAAS